jgi:hypothetical protein
MKKQPSKLAEGFRYLVDKIYNGNVSSMSRHTGVSRAVITEVISGKQSDVNSSTLAKLSQTGVNLNWLLTGEGKPFIELTAGKQELSEDHRVQNHLVMIETLANEIEEQIQDNPDLVLSQDVQLALLRLIQSAIRS